MNREVQDTRRGMHVLNADFRGTYISVENFNLEWTLPLVDSPEVAPDHDSFADFDLKDETSWLLREN